MNLGQWLARGGTASAFGVPGGGANLDLVGALAAEGVKFVLAHGESASAIMASTHGLLTASPTPVVVTRGPGATSVANGVAQATLDRFPLLVITDTVPSAQRCRVAHQRLDQRAFFAPITKRSATVADDVDATDLLGLIGDATMWPFGAVHLDYDAAGTTDLGTATLAATQSPPQAIEEAIELVRQAQRPVVILGAEAAAHPDHHQLTQLLSAFEAPVLSTYQATGLVDTEGPVSAGLFTNGALERPVLASADVIITLGLDLVEPIPAPWNYTAPVVRLSSTNIEDDYMPIAVDVVGPLVEAATAVLQPSDNHTWPPTAAHDFRDQARAAITQAESSDSFGPVQLVKTAASRLPANITTTVDAGAHFLAIMPLWPTSQPHRLLISNGLATMGFAVPAAIGAAMARPGEPVLALTGDGGMSMTLAELETIARRDLPITVIVFNDAALSLIRIKQDPDPSKHGGAAAVNYTRTEFADAARAMGIDGFVVESAPELRTRLTGGWDTPRLIDARIDPSSYPALLTATRG